ncbi:MAG: hypothetical protein H7Y32_11465, partial [Chloroflexales bacterium]|nr:hypothetical protein [Chloroflexales bacterium]
MNAQRPFAIPHSLRWVAGTAALVGTLLALGLVQAQPPTPARAGVVIQFGDGRVTRACVELGDDGQATGEEALLAVGLPVIVEAGGVGAAVCKVDAEGCDYPATGCFCQCSLGAGASCRYWAYNRLVAGQWQLSNIGASNTIVRAGDVEGWAWGDGSVSSGARPPQTTFSEVCAVAAATSTATATPTLIPSSVAAEPSATATAGPVVYVPLVGQPAPVTPLPSVSPSITTAPTATPQPLAAATTVATPAPAAPLPATAAPTTRSTSTATAAPPTVASSPTAATPAPVALASTPTGVSATTTRALPVSAPSTQAPAAASPAAEQSPAPTASVEQPLAAPQTVTPQRRSPTPSATATTAPIAIAQAASATTVPARATAKPTRQEPPGAAP